MSDTARIFNSTICASAIASAFELGVLDELRERKSLDVRALWFDRAGNHHSAAMTVVERCEMIGTDHILYEATIDDPETFSRPWTIRMPLYKNIDPHARLGQFKCVEFVEELLYGHLRKQPIR